MPLGETMTASQIAVVTLTVTKYHCQEAAVCPCCMREGIITNNPVMGMLCLVLGVGRVSTIFTGIGCEIWSHYMSTKLFFR